MMERGLSWLFHFLARAQRSGFKRDSHVRGRCLHATPIRAEAFMAEEIRRSVTAMAVVAFMALAAVAPAVAQGSSLREGIDQLAADLVRNMVTPRVLRLAVADFPDLRGSTSDLGRYVAERLTTRLSAVTNRFAVAERRRLQQVVAELSLNQGDLVDPRSARRVGEMLGVDALLVGTVSPLGDRLDLDCRLVEIETNSVVTQGSVSIIRDQVVEGLLAAGRDEGAHPSELRDTVPVGRQAISQPPSATPSLQFASGDFSGQVLGATRSGAEVRIELLLTNRGEMELGISSCNNSYIIDDTGQRGNCTRSTGSRRLVSQVPLRVAFEYSGISGSARSVTLVWNWRYGTQLVVRQIPLQ